MTSTIETEMRTYTAEYDLGDRVYLIVRPEPIEGMVVRISVYPGAVMYGVRWANSAIEANHYGIELTTEAPI